jgi:hypothetical protein
MGIEVNVSPDELGDNYKIKTDQHSGIELREELNEDLTVNTIFNPDISDGVDSVPVGGAIAKLASYWKGLNLPAVLAEILFPDLMATYTVPTLLLIADTDSVLREVGITYAKTFTIRALENDAGAFTSMTLVRNGSVIWSGLPTAVQDTALPEQYNFPNPNNPNWLYEHIALVQGANAWYSGGHFNAGTAKKNNKGATDTRTAALLSPNAPQAAGSITSSYFTVNADYPIFWGVSNTVKTADEIKAIIEAGTANKSVVSAVGDLNIEFAAAGQYLWFAYWSGYSTKTKWAVQGINRGYIGGSIGLFGDYTQKFVNSPSGYWAGVGFKIHVSNYPTTTNGVMTLRNT